LTAALHQLSGLKARLIADGRSGRLSEAEVQSSLNRLDAMEDNLKETARK
jgi:hypothetical protein